MTVLKESIQILKIKTFSNEYFSLDSLAIEQFSLFRTRISNTVFKHEPAYGRGAFLLASSQKNTYTFTSFGGTRLVLASQENAACSSKLKFKLTL